jgi:ABC-type lipoprotein release transport system permease subunit
MVNEAFVNRYFNGFVVVALAMLASFIPARRASKIDFSTALREN